MVRRAHPTSHGGDGREQLGAGSDGGRDVGVAHVERVEAEAHEVRRAEVADDAARGK